ncbi:hypothetical protein TraAM80_06489 [Trypanosoma rangeli]|uniref:NAD(P)-binding domain-containing protein n=1 Tax=Trypanosoma rangeli TaxID=5698 RepID=A0A422NA30_TRYRA|nr:uncharacterized protein TraAM80_06489 [Trypanosoma rangeli]RNF02303.1 hypothetical protein TraAM80_06489 [Trypanosoma rangeli]|eukprot:RNF02303.1 hypothetical protein TraAM80_06489 [Trypanosoma rangeli]
MSLIVAGSTGAIGRCVVREALKRDEFARVLALTRSSSLSDPAALFGLTVVSEASEASAPDTITKEQLTRLMPVSVDWEEFLRFWQRRKARQAGATANISANVDSGEDPEAVHYNELFSGHKYAAMCLGTTRRDAGSAAAFARCDYDYVVAFAEALREFSGQTLVTYAQVSAQFANKNSWLLYSKVKGRADAAVEALRFPRLSLYRPGLLDRGAKTRFNEKILNWFLRGIPVEICGRAIVNDFVHSSDAASLQSRQCAGKRSSATALGESKDESEVYIFANDNIKKEAAYLK